MGKMGFDTVAVIDCRTRVVSLGIQQVECDSANEQHKVLSFLKILQKFTSWIAGILNRWPFDKSPIGAMTKSNFFQLINVKWLQLLKISLEVPLWAIVA
jgi:hypothetical protein